MIDIEAQNQIASGRSLRDPQIRGFFSSVRNIASKAVKVAAPVAGAIVGGPVGFAVGTAAGQAVGKAVAAPAKRIGPPAPKAATKPPPIKRPGGAAAPAAARPRMKPPAGAVSAAARSATNDQVSPPVAILGMSAVVFGSVAVGTLALAGAGVYALTRKKGKR